MQGRTTPGKMMILPSCGVQNARTDLASTSEWHIDAASIAAEECCAESHPQQRNERCPILANGHGQSASKPPFRGCML